MPVKVIYFLTHVIQYVAPVMQRLAQRPELDFQVVYGSDAGVREFYDPEFGRAIAWDRSLLEGYRYTVMTPGAPVRRGFWGFRSRGLADLVVRGETEVVIVHGWSRHLYASAIVSALARGVAVLNRTDGQAGQRGRTVLRPLKPLVIHPLLRRLDGHLVVGSRNRQYYLDAGVKPDRLFWAPFCVDTDLFRREAVSAEEVRAGEERLGLRPGSFRPIFVGKLVERKRPADIIEAVARMPSRSRVELLFVGEGELRARLEALAAAKGVRAHFLGFRGQKELPGLYALASVNLLVSSYDPWGLVINEGMTAGLPSIVSDVVGCGPDLVLEGRTGYVRRVGDVAGLAQALEQMAADPELLGRMKQAALERVQAFSLDVTLAGHLEAIQTVAARARAARARADRRAPVSPEAGP